MSQNKKLGLTILFVSIVAVFVVGGLLVWGAQILAPVFNPPDNAPSHGPGLAEHETPTPEIIRTPSDPPEYGATVLAGLEDLTSAAKGILTSHIAYVSKTALNVRVGPGIQFARTAVLAEGSRLVIYSCVSGTGGHTWAKLTIKDSDSQLWVRADLLSPYPCQLINAPVDLSAPAIATMEGVK